MKFSKPWIAISAIACLVGAVLIGLVAIDRAATYLRQVDT